MKKTLLLLAVLFTTTWMWAGNVITYTATSKLTEVTGSYNNGLHTNAFGSGVSITSHTFSDGTGTITFNSDITEFGFRAFYGCRELTSITIPNSVTSIGVGAFEDCSGLTSITIPNSVTSIGNYAFERCSGLTSLTIPNSVTSIGNYAFSSCSGLTSITIPNSVTSIGSDAFYYCSGLTSITIPNSVTAIGYRAFEGCSGLIAINVDNSNPNYLSEDGVLFNKNKTKLIQYPGGRQGEYSIPNGVTSIEERAFYKCSGLTSLTIPNSVTSIGDLAFCDCSALTSVTIPNSVTSIGSDAFSKCSGLTSVTIPNSVTSIRDRAFYGCSGLTSVTIPNSVTSIGAYAFAYCSSLKTVYDYARLPQNLGSYAFGKVETLYVVSPTSVDYYILKGWDQYFNNILPMTDEMLDVKNIQCDTPATQTYYDLNGRKMKEPQRGLNIINGKKVVVK